MFLKTKSLALVNSIISNPFLLRKVKTKYALIINPDVTIQTFEEYLENYESSTDVESVPNYKQLIHNISLCP